MTEETNVAKTVETAVPTAKRRVRNPNKINWISILKNGGGDRPEVIATSDRKNEIEQKVSDFLSTHTETKRSDISVYRTTKRYTPEVKQSVTIT